MILAEKLKSRNLIVASGSPRRQQFIKDLGLDFEVRLKPVQETYPDTLEAVEIAEHLAKLKAAVFLDELRPKDILITGDTVVYHENKVLDKPKTEKEAFAMLESLSGNSHEVISSTCLTSTQKYVLVYDVTKVYFKKLKAEEINYYIKNFKPFDKAGAYGIQEWIGKIGIEKIEGSFYNVMGMPVNKVYQALKVF
ncbi:MAG TPA: Maf family nucleotide pyrophosphatase [Flavobacteriaceae bacterium]|nr:Maf family nucleotide pyrophosphatase [Flavobacteriaceae bacterium]